MNSFHFHMLSRCESSNQEQHEAYNYEACLKTNVILIES